jgi:hypothetical protein
VIRSGDELPRLHQIWLWRGGPSVADRSGLLTQQAIDRVHRGGRGGLRGARRRRCLPALKRSEHEQHRCPSHPSIVSVRLARRFPSSGRWHATGCCSRSPNRGGCGW